MLQGLAASANGAACLSVPPDVAAVGRVDAVQRQSAAAALASVAAAVSVAAVALACRNASVVEIGVAASGAAPSRRASYTADWDIEDWRAVVAVVAAAVAVEVSCPMPDEIAGDAAVSPDAGLGAQDAVGVPGPAEPSNSCPEDRWMQRVDQVDASWVGARRFGLC